MRRSCSKLMVRSFLFVFAASLVASAQAAPIVYGDYAGTTVDYLGVQEESATDPGSGFFGAPNVAGDVMDFDPQAFAATSSGPDSDITDSNLQFMIKAKPGNAITNVFFTEAGDTTLAGLAGEAVTSVSTSIFIDVVEVDGAPVGISGSLIGTMIFTPKDEYKLSTGDSGSTEWTGTLNADLGPYLAANGITGNVTKVNVSLDNTLRAESVQGTSAFIQKKDADALIITVETMNIIPEPSTFISALIAVGVGVLVKRRK